MSDTIRRNYDDLKSISSYRKLITELFGVFGSLISLTYTVLTMFSNNFLNCNYYYNLVGNFKPICLQKDTPMTSHQMISLRLKAGWITILFHLQIIKLRVYQFIYEIIMILA